MASGQATEEGSVSFSLGRQISHSTYYFYPNRSCTATTCQLDVGFDTSRGGRYHNRRYAALARELGLEVARVGGIGWSATTLPEATAAAYTSVLAELEARLVLWRRQETAGQATSRNLLVCVCGCPRRIRVVPATLAQAPILCGACGLPFTP